MELGIVLYSKLKPKTRWIKRRNEGTAQRKKESVVENPVPVLELFLDSGGVLSCIFHFFS